MGAYTTLLKIYAIFREFHICSLVVNILYSQTPEIKTADLSQSHASLNLSQFRAYYLFHRNSIIATKYNCSMRLMLEISQQDF